MSGSQPRQHPPDDDPMDGSGAPHEHWDKQASKQKLLKYAMDDIDVRNHGASLRYFPFPRPIT